MNEKQEHFLLECVAYALVAINPRKHHDILSYVFNKYKKLGEDSEEEKYCENCQCWDNATGFCHVKMIITLADEVCESYKKVK